MIGQITVFSEGSQFTVHSDAMAMTRINFTPTLVAMSVCGPEPAIKAIRAILWDKSIEATYTARGFTEERDGHWKMYRGDDKYQVATAKLGLGAFHLVAVAEWDGLLRAISDEALWRELRSERYTTPLLRHWMPSLRQTLTNRGLMGDVESFGCEVGRLIVTQEQLDSIVTEGVLSGAFKMKGE